VGFAILSFVIIDAPQWISAVWGFFSNEPLFPWLMRHHIPHLAFSAWFITAPVGALMFFSVLWIQTHVPYISERNRAKLLVRRETALASSQSGTQQSLDLRFSVLDISYDDATTELGLPVQFCNSGTTSRTILSVAFGYRDPDRLWNNSWEFIRPIRGGRLGNVEPIRIEADSEHVVTFRAVIPFRMRQKRGGIIGILLNATSPDGTVKDKHAEVLEISNPAPEGSNGISFTGKRAQNISFDT
jgi:hypothetical protein